LSGFIREEKREKKGLQIFETGRRFQKRLVPGMAGNQTGNINWK